MKDIRSGLDLRYALERNELVLYYQPAQTGYAQSPVAQCKEALLRWRHPEHKLIAPDKFINLAEETGLIIPIGEWVSLKQSAHRLKTGMSRVISCQKLPLTWSARQFRDKELINNISRILSETGVEAKYIALEITESMLIDNIEKSGRNT